MPAMPRRLQTRARGEARGAEIHTRDFCCSLGMCWCPPWFCWLIPA